MKRKLNEIGVPLAPTENSVAVRMDKGAHREKEAFPTEANSGLAGGTENV